MSRLKIHHHIKHHISRIRHVRPRTPEMYLYLKDPMVAAAFLVFGMIALVLSIFNFTAALLY